MSAMIEVENLNKTYGTGHNAVQVLRNVGFCVERGDFVAIMGQSGSGKSTLMNILGCLDRQTSGVCRIDGVDIATLDHNGLADLRGRCIGFIFQQYNLLATLSATENVALPAVYAGMRRSERLARATHLLEQLGLADRLKNRPTELSGGQQQRVSIARALMNGGDIILADEPTGALDTQSGENVLAVLSDLNRRGHTVIMVTHDPTVAAHAHRTIEIRDGQIIADTRRVPEPAALTAEPRLRPVGEQSSRNVFRSDQPAHFQDEKALRTRECQPPQCGVDSWENDVFSKNDASKRNVFRSDQLAEALAMSMQAIWSHKMRAALTMLGIIIGIASVVSAVALGRGAQERIIANISSMGTNTINVYPGRGFGDQRSSRVKTLTVADSEALGRQSYIANATPSVSANGTLVYGNESLSAQVSGVGEEYFDVKGLKLASGRFFDRNDRRSTASVVVIDDNTRKKLFPNGEDPVGAILLFQRRPLEIIGVTEKQDSVFGPTDSLNLWSPYTTVMHKITGQSYISSIAVKMRDDVRPLMVEQNLTALLKSRHRGVEDFFTVNTDTIKQTIEKTTGTLALLISGIALISLIVGGIGVMNIMLVSVTERTREIGVRIAIGAKRRNILEQFLIEAVLLCVIGGLMGVTLSFMIGLLFSLFVSDFAMSYSTGSILLALMCSSGIGILFGFMPARNASRLNPIEALARE